METSDKPKPLKFESEVIEFKKINNNLRYLKLSVPKNFIFIPGQFVSFIIEKNGNKVRRPYSMASPPSQKGSIDIVYKLIPEGLTTPLLENTKNGDKILLNGPIGEFTIKNHDKDLIFISTGTGIAPFMSIIPSLLEGNFKDNIILLTGYKDENNIINDKEFKELEKKYSNFKYYKTLSHPSNNYKGETGRVQQLVEKYLKDSKNTNVYICGLTDMINSVRILLRKKGIEMKNIYSEKYD